MKSIATPGTATIRMDSYPLAGLSYEALHKLAGKLLLATKITGIGVWEYCLHTNSFIADEVAHSLYGAPASDIAPDFDTWLRFVHEEDKVSVKQAFFTALHTLAEGTIEFRVVWEDGSVHTIMSIVSIERDRQGRAHRVVGINKDITAQKAAENAIRESEAKYRAFFENSMDGLLLMGTDGNILASNPAACDIFGMTEEELRSAGRKGLVNTADPGFQALLQERETNGRAKGEITLRKKDGTTFPGEVTSATFTDACGNKRTSMIIRDATTRKVAEQQLMATSGALQQAVNGLNRIMDSSPDMICAIDKEGIFLNMSSAASLILGYEPHELIGKNYQELVWHEDVEHTRMVAEGVMKGMPVTMLENRNIRRDGSLVPMLWSARWSAGEEVMYCIGKDATEKKRMEQAFDSERQRFYDFFRNAPSSLVILKGPNHVFELANDQFLRMAGRKNVIGKTLHQSFPEVESQGLVAMIDAVYATGESIVANEQFVQLQDEKTGRQKNIYTNFFCQPYRNTKNEVDGIFVFINDVTEQVLARENINRRRAKLQAILSNTDIGYILLSGKLDIIAFNRVASEFAIATNRPPLQEGSNYFAYFNTAEAELEAEKQNTGKVLGGASLEYEMQMPAAGGETRWYLIKMNPIFLEKDHKVDGICIAIEDITGAKQTEIEKEKMTADLIQRNTDLEQFSYIVSHNVRSHVANIAGICELLNDEPCASELHDDFWEQLCISVQHLDSVLKDVNSILQVKKEVKECTDQIQFSGLVRHIEESIGCQLKTAGAAIHTNFSAVDNITSMRSYLYSIFYNLITNSVKYRRTNIPLVVEVWSEKDGDKIKLFFKDNGLGIDMQRKEDQLFKLYKKFHPHVEGKGMGLFMTKIQVESLGGKIELESKVNEGTLITITL